MVVTVLAMKAYEYKVSDDIAALILNP